MNNCSLCTISLSLGAAGAVSHLLDNVGAIPVKNKEDSSLLNIDDYKKKKYYMYMRFITSSLYSRLYNCFTDVVRYDNSLTVCQIENETYGFRQDNMIISNTVY